MNYKGKKQQKERQYALQIGNLFTYFCEDISYIQHHLENSK